MYRIFFGWYSVEKQRFLVCSPTCTPGDNRVGGAEKAPTSKFLGLDKGVIKSDPSIWEDQTLMPSRSSKWISTKRKVLLGGGNSNILYFQAYLGKWSNLTNIFQMGWNHQVEIVLFGAWFSYPVVPSFSARILRGQKKYQPKKHCTKANSQKITIDVYCLIPPEMGSIYLGCPGTEVRIHGERINGL